jgi:putative transposase
MVPRTNLAWVTDVTYVGTRQGLLYLAAVLGRYSRKVVGWSMKPTFAHKIVLDSLLLAVWRRKPAGQVLVLSDRGSQNGNEYSQFFCLQHNLVPRVGRWGTCWHNTVAGSFLGTLQAERVCKRVFQKEQAGADFFDPIEISYLCKASHDHLGGVIQGAFEAASR